MKKIILQLLMTLLFVVAADAQAQEWCDEGFSYLNKSNFFAKIFGGVNFLQNTAIDGNTSKYHTGYIISSSVGYCWCYGLSLEGEYAFRRNTVKKIHFDEEGFAKHGHFQTSSYMANLLWNMSLSSRKCSFGNIQPFIGAGIGYDFQRMHSSNSRINFNQKWHHFSWQVMGGLAYPIFCNTEISLEYKFHQGGCHFNNHAIGVGLTYKFDFN
jgi:opacity protein-like surface antigen